MNQSKYSSLDEALKSVARELQPARDLWPGISGALDPRAERPTGAPMDLASARAARIARTPRAQWPTALAASLGVVALVAALYWSVVRERTAPNLVAHGLSTAAAGHVLVNFGPPEDPAYTAARAEREQTFNDRLKMLAPATQQRVQADLQTIRQANADLRAALAHDPASPLLLQLLHSTGQQEIDLYTSVAQSTEPLLTRRVRL
jgi:hypothetical protein